jgi:hypothetical protein
MASGLIKIRADPENSKTFICFQLVIGHLGDPAAIP